MEAQQLKLSGKFIQRLRHLRYQIRIQERFLELCLVFLF